MGIGVEPKFLFFPHPAKWPACCFLGAPPGKVQPSRPRGPEQTSRAGHTATCFQRGARAAAPTPAQQLPPQLSSHASRALG